MSLNRTEESKIVRCKIRFLFLFLFFLNGCVSLNRSVRKISSAATNEPVIAIFGDVHEEFSAEDKMLSQFKNFHVTDIVGMGDFISFGGLQPLEEALAKITPATGVSKSHTYLCPGNWEQTLNDPQTVDTILAKYGHVIVPDYDRAANFEIEGMVVRAGHFPQHEVPADLLPPPQLIQKIEGQITLVETLVRQSEPDATDAIELFAHTHVAGIYFDSKAGVWSLNGGVIAAHRKRASEPQAYALWYPTRHLVRFVNVVTDQILREVNLDDPNEPCKAHACVFWK